MAIVPQCHDKISTISPQINSNKKVLVPSTISSYSEWPINPKLDIRILELLPASPDNTQIHGNLTVAKLSDNPSYEALSYVWGDQVFPEKLNLCHLTALGPLSSCIYITSSPSTLSRPYIYPYFTVTTSYQQGILRSREILR